MVLRRISLKDGERLLYPVVPALITAEENGRVGGMLAAWWSQLSFRPFLIGVAIAPERYTYRLIINSKIFGINFLDFKYVEKAPYLGDVSERFMKGKIKKAGLNIIRGKVLNTPLIAEASAALEAKLIDIFETGDHDWFVGEIVAAYATEDFQNGMWTLRKYRPLMYLGRTRRPGPVYRVYLTAEEFIRRELEFAGGPLKRYSQIRHEVRDKFLKEASKLGETTRDKAISALMNIALEYGLDIEDVKAYLKEAEKAGKIKIKD